MHYRLRTALMSAAALALSIFLVRSYCGTNTMAEAASDPRGTYSPDWPREVVSGTRINVALSSSISSETATVGTVWYGTVTENVMTENEGVIPPGSVVEGVVTGVTPTRTGARAMLDLCIRGIRVDGRNEAIAANTDAVEAESARARSLGAFGGEPTTSAPIGGSVRDVSGGESPALLDGAVVARVVAPARGRKLVLTDGTVMTFTVSATMAMR